MSETRTERQFNRRLDEHTWSLMEALKLELGLKTDRALIEFLVRERARELGLKGKERWPSKSPEEDMEDHRSGAV